MSASAEAGAARVHRQRRAPRRSSRGARGRPAARTAYPGPTSPVSPVPYTWSELAKTTGTRGQLGDVAHAGRVRLLRVVGLALRDRPAGLRGEEEDARRLERQQLLDLLARRGCRPSPPGAARLEPRELVAVGRVPVVGEHDLVAGVERLLGQHRAEIPGAEDEQRGVGFGHAPILPAAAAADWGRFGTKSAHFRAPHVRVSPTRLEAEWALGSGDQPRGRSLELRARGARSDRVDGRPGRDDVARVDDAARRVPERLVEEEPVRGEEHDAVGALDLGAIPLDARRAGRRRARSRRPTGRT